MAKLYNIARMTTATSGTGTATLGSAVSSYITFADAGVADGDQVTYALQEGNNLEIGRGTYNSAGPTLSRTTVLASTNGGAKISLTGGAHAFIAASAQDMQSDVAITGGTISGITWGTFTSLTFSTTFVGSALFSEDITGTLTDYAPAGFATNFAFRLNPTSNRTFISMDGAAAGRMALIINRSGFIFTITHDDGATGTATMRFVCPGSVNAKLRANTPFWVYYDGTSQRWRVMNAPAFAQQAEMEAATNNAYYDTPSQHALSPFVPKVWLRATGAGVATESGNMTSVTDTGTGDLDGTIATDFSSATWASFPDIVRASWDTTNVFVNQMVCCDAKAAGTFGLQCVNFSTSTTTGNNAVALADPATDYSFMGFGDL